MSAAGLMARVRSQINSTTVPFPFDIVALFPVPSRAVAKDAEKELFRRIADRRASDRDFFHALPGEQTDELLTLVEQVIEETVELLGEHEDEDDRPLPNLTGRTIEQMVDEALAVQARLVGSGDARGGWFGTGRAQARAAALLELGLDPRTAGTDSVKIAAQLTGFSNKQDFHRASRVVRAARDDPALYQPVLNDMNRTGRINRAYSKLKTIEAAIAARSN